MKMQRYAVSENEITYKLSICQARPLFNLSSRTPFYNLSSLTPFSKGSIRYKEIKLPQHVKAFCIKLAQTEKNKFIGIDLMKFENSFFCLESNPGPGWSTYHHSSKKKFAKIYLSNY